MQAQNEQHIRNTAREHQYELFLASRFARDIDEPAIWSLLALDYELSRIPSVTQEEMIRMIRLTWWREAMEEIYAQKPPRKHEVCTPLAETIQCYSIPQALMLSLWEAHQEYILHEGPHPKTARLLWQTCHWVAEGFDRDLKQVGDFAELYDQQRSLRARSMRESISVEAEALQAEYDALKQALPKTGLVPLMRVLFEENQRRLLRADAGACSYSIVRPSLKAYFKLLLFKLKIQ